MTIDKRTKMIDKDRIVVMCVTCGRQQIVSKDAIPTICSCSAKDTLVIVNNLIVTK